MAGENQTVGPVTFDYEWWARRYPDLAMWVNPEQGSMFFDMATTMLDNTANSRVKDIGRRQILLNLLVAHVATLFGNLNGQASPGGVGRVASAAQGSVNVSFEYPEVPGAEWFNQTKYGAMYWTMTKVYRMGRYHVGPQKFSQDLPFRYSRGVRSW